MQRLRNKGWTLFTSMALPQLKKKAMNSISAVQDTYASTKDTFERHKVVFSVGTSIASVATAWAGYTIRAYHQSKVDQKLETIEKALKQNHQMEHSEIKRIVNSGSLATSFATAGTTFLMGYAFGWRGGRWYTQRKYRKEQMKLLGKITPKRCQLLGRIKPRVDGGRPKLFSTISDETLSAFASVAEDHGICSSVVEPLKYPCEEHTVTTEDGYILSVQRIPSGHSSEDSGDRIPVLLQHGLLMDGVTWLLSPPGQSLALILADNGFDVWIANTRGTNYSQGHTSLSPDDNNYWDWTWDELMAYDLPATVQYVYGQSGQNLHYVGHSLGTLIALTAFSQNELMGMLRSAALLSPIAYIGQMTSPLGTVAASHFVAEKLYKKGYVQFNPRGEVAVRFLQTICSSGVDCTHLLTSFTGPNCCLNPSIVGVFLDHEPQSTSIKDLMHISQMIRGGTLNKYDYGNEEENRKHYGQPTPPAYNMANIPNDFPLFLSYGGADALSDVNDVQSLLDSLSDHQGDKLVIQYRPDYAHADYVMADNARQAVYDPLMAFFRLQ